MMRRTCKAARGLCMALALVFLLAMLPAAVYAETNKEKMERLKGELADINASIKQAEQDAKSAGNLAAQYREEKRIIEELLDANWISINETEADIEAKQAEIAQKREVIYENQTLFEERLVAIYKMNNAGLLSTMFNVNTFSELLTMTDALKTITEHDTGLLDMLREEREQLEAEKVELDTMLDELNAKHAELADLRDMYAENIAKQDAAKSKAEAQMEADKATYGEKSAEYEKARKAELATAGNVNNTGSNASDGSKYEGGAFTWPVPKYYEISCYFGAADPNGAAHRGMDIRGSGITGADIVACADGKVIIASTSHASYGQYVVVDHGGGLKTLYAHCSALYVAVGDQVSAGSTIAAVGSTGFVTGPHLHLEVHLNGALQNPLNYLY